jgi:hypothetical protein
MRDYSSFKPCIEANAAFLKEPPNSEKEAEVLLNYMNAEREIVKFLGDRAAEDVAQMILEMKNR